MVEEINQVQIAAETEIVVAQRSIAIIGLGYVGLPLAIEFGKHYNVMGFDINQERIAELSEGHDRTKEADMEELLEAMNMTPDTKLRSLNISKFTKARSVVSECAKK